MTHLLVKVVDFVIVGPYCLRALFNQIRLDLKIHTLLWPNDADFDPATLYHWREGDGAELAERPSKTKAP